MWPIGTIARYMKAMTDWAGPPAPKEDKKREAKPIFLCSSNKEFRKEIATILYGKEEEDYFD